MRVVDARDAAAVLAAAQRTPRAAAAVWPVASAVVAANEEFRQGKGPPGIVWGQGEGKVTFFAIDVRTVPGQAWRVWKRFSQFDDCRRRMKPVATLPLPAFPSKGFGKASGEKLAQRQAQLRDWLHEVVGRAAAGDEGLRDAVSHFLCVEERIRSDPATNGVPPQPRTPEAPHRTAAAVVTPGAPPRLSVLDSDHSQQDDGSDETGH